MKKRREEGGGQEWLNTYADMITLVLTFFVLLYSISNVNISKLEEIAAAMQRQLGIETTSDLEDVPQDLKYPSISEGANAPEGEGSQFNTGSGAGSQSASSLAMADMAKDIQSYFQVENLDAVVSDSENAVYIRFKNDLLFAPDSAVLQENSKSMLEALGIMLRDRQDEIMAIYINGHTAQAANSLINDRLLAGKPTIISTNLSTEDIARRYTPQIASRLRGSYKRVPFVGDDIRILKNGGLSL